MKGRVNDVAEDWNGDDDCERVEVAEEVVGCTLGDHSGALICRDGSDTPIVHIIDRKVEEDRAGKKSPSDIFDVLLRPRDFDARLSEDGRLGVVPVILAPKLALVFLDSHGNDLEELSQLGTHWWFLDGPFVHDEQ